MGCNAKCCAMHNVADISGAILNMVLQNGIVCCERCCVYEMCDRNDGVTWSVVWFGINVRHGQCLMWNMMMQRKMWWNDVMRCEMQ